jgi:hypothetical protein
MATTIGNLITIDGQFADWPGAGFIERPGNTVANYQVYGALIGDATFGNTYVIGLDAAVPTDPVIGAATFIYLNTDQNVATGYSPFGSVGAEYYVQFSTDGAGSLQPYIYSITSSGTSVLLNNGVPLTYALSGSGQSIEIAFPQNLLTPSGGASPHSVNFAALINNGAAALPGDFSSSPQYTITDPSILVPVDHAIKKVGIVYSATTAALYFGGTPAGQTAYSDLFMAAQHQAAAAGVSYDLLSEADLTDVAKLAQYSALIFPNMQYVQSSAVPEIVNALSQVVYEYHVPLITSGHFLTNDQAGAPLPGNPYANMEALLDLTQSGFGTATYSVTPDSTALTSHHPVMAGYTAGELIGGASGQFPGTTAGLYTNTGYLTFSGVTQPATVLADINIQGGASLPGVVQTATGGTNTHFATTSLLGDSNLLQQAIQNAVFGTTPSLSLDVSRMAGVVASRNDMDQSQYPLDVSPDGQPGIYDAMLPILQQWKQQYNFVGSYYITIGDNANPANGNSTNWAVSTPYYHAILALGSEIGNHSYTHLINPPAVDANGNPIPTTVINGEVVSTWNENTNTLYVTPPANGSAPNWTFEYEFGQAKTIEQQNIGITIAGAAVPGAGETIGTSQQIMQYYQSVAGVTGYVTGGWTGVGSGYPNAIGYLTPADTGSVYIAPNITFDFSEIEFQKKTPAQALADWQALFQQLSSHSQAPVIVWPWHDYGPTNWSTDGGAGSGPGYTTQMFTDFIAFAHGAGYEFVTMADLAARTAAQQKAAISQTTNGNVITATVTPDPAAPDLGAMALNVVNGGAGQVIQNAGNWYAYDSDSIFLPRNGGTFTVTLGSAQDDVTHVSALPMRADLRTVTGDGSNLAFSMAGDGVVHVDLKAPGTNIVSIQGAPAASLTGDDLVLTFNDGPLAISPSSPQGVPVLHTVSISQGASAVVSSGTSILFGGSGTNALTLTGLYENYTARLNADGSDTITDTRSGTPDGTDIVYNFQNFQFANGLVLTTAQLNGAGVLLGTSANNALTSALAGQVVLALAGNDALTAGAANQVLDGGTGDNTFADGGFAGVTLIGATGNDTFTVRNAATKVLDMTNGGADTVRTTLTSYLLPGSIESLVYFGAAGINAAGNALDNTFSGFTGASTLDGGAGSDTASFTGQLARYAVTLNPDGSVRFVDTRAGSPDGTVTIRNMEFFRFSDGLVLTASQLTGSGGTVVSGTAGNDTLTSTIVGALIQGLGGADTLTAGAINQSLNGGAGADILRDGGFAGVSAVGGAGNDTYVVGNALTTVTELADNGNDTVQTTATSYAAPVNVENVTFIGSGDFTATANASGQRLTGAAGADTLSDGGLANGRLVGAGGNDSYTVSNAMTVVTEAAGGGTDTVKTSLASYTLPGNVDNLTFTGTTAFTGTGNALANVITGGAANDVLTANGGNDTVIGGAGADRMSGSGGADTFVFAPVNPTTANGIYVAGFGHDVITDFTANAGNVNHDILLFSSSIFAPGTTAAALLGGTAQNAAGTLVAVAQSGANVVITVDPTDTITLNNVSLATLRAGAAADIHFS